MRKLFNLHPHREFAAAYTRLPERNTGWRYFMILSANERIHSLRQIFVMQVAFVLGTVLIFSAHWVQPTVDRATLYLWLAESTANQLVRLVLVLGFATRSPTVATVNVFWRLVPTMSIGIVGAHWIWTGFLFVDQSWSFGMFTTLLVFMLMSIGSIAYTPTSPLPAIAYLASLWVPVVWILWPVGQFSSAVFIVLFLGIFSVLCMSMYVTQGPLRNLLVKAAEVDELVEKLQASNTELQSMRNDATTQLTERSHFFAGASHDFAQRLHALKLLAHGVQFGERNTHERSLAALSRAITDLENYLRDVLEFARIDSRIDSPQYQAVHLQDVFQRLAVQFETVAENRQIDLRFRTTSATMFTDQGVLTRVLENIVGNAVKFTRRGVLVAARRRGASWCVEVWDQGPGIPAEAIESIFSSFYQGRVYADSERIAVGLGLAIVKRLAEGLRYRIEVQSRVGRGSVFKIYLPNTNPGNKP
jgi:signal transduction histidine kinase